MYVLNFEEAGRSRREVLQAGDTVVGRAAICDLVVDDPSISRRHAQFSVTGKTCTLVDLGSSNGTLVNGKRVSRSTVGDGDSVVLGSVPFTIDYSAADQLSFSENHPILDEPGTIFRPVGTVSGDGWRGTPFNRSARLLTEVGRSLVQAKPLGEVLNQVVQLAFDTCPADRAFLVLRDSTGGLVPRVACQRDGSDIGVVSISRAVVNRVMTDRVALLATDVEMDTGIRSSQTLRAQQVRSFICAPLWNEHDVIGVLYVDASSSQRFAEADLDLMTALSNFAAVAIDHARLSARLVEEARWRERLQRYHSPAVITRILEAGTDVSNAFLAQERDVTVLFADIDGFTALSEAMTPAETAQLLNTFFGRMEDIVFENDGTLDKFIGDALMAVFGAPLEQPDHAIRAVRTAQLMQRAVAELNREAMTSKPLTVRIGVHSGLALSGDIGSLRRRDYTVLGDVVNIASRLESEVAKAGQVVISRATCDLVGGTIAARPLGSVTVRGRQRAIEVFEVDTSEGSHANVVG